MEQRAAEHGEDDRQGHGSGVGECSGCSPRTMPPVLREESKSAVRAYTLQPSRFLRRFHVQEPFMQSSTHRIASVTLPIVMAAGAASAFAQVMVGGAPMVPTKDII